MKYLRPLAGLLLLVVLVIIPACQKVMDDTVLEPNEPQAVPFLHATTISPLNGQDANPANLTIVYNFSEGVKQTPYTRTDLGFGSGTMIDDIDFTYDGLKKGTSAVSFSAKWNSAFTELTITPRDLIGSGKYRVNILGVVLKLVNSNDLRVVDNPNLTGDFEDLAFTTQGNNPTPAKPVAVRRFVTGLFDALNYGGGNVQLTWGLQQNIRGFNVYKKIGRGALELYQSNVPGPLFSDVTGSLVAPAPTASSSSTQMQTVQYVVRGVSYDLIEGDASDPVVIQDGVKPRISSASSSADPSGTTNAWVYTIKFTEPMDFSKADREDFYLFSNTGAVTFTINQATPLGWVTGTNTYDVRLYVTSSAARPVGYILTVGTQISDVTGNAMDTATNGNSWTF